MQNHAKFMKSLTKLIKKTPALKEYTTINEEESGTSFLIEISALADRNAMKAIKNIFTGDAESKINWAAATKGSLILKVDPTYRYLVVFDVQKKVIFKEEETIKETAGDVCEEDA